MARRGKAHFIDGSWRQAQELNCFIVDSIARLPPGVKTVPGLLDLWKSERDLTPARLEALKKDVQDRLPRLADEKRGVEALKRISHGVYAVCGSPAQAKDRISTRSTHVAGAAACLRQNGGFAKLDQIRAYLGLEKVTSGARVDFFKRPEAEIVAQNNDLQYLQRDLKRSKYIQSFLGGKGMYHLPLSELDSMVLEGRWARLLAHEVRLTTPVPVRSSFNNNTLCHKLFEQVGSLIEMRRTDLDLSRLDLVADPAVLAAIKGPAEAYCRFVMGTKYVGFLKEHATESARAEWFLKSVEYEDHDPLTHHYLRTPFYVAVADRLHMNAVAMSRGYAVPMRFRDTYHTVDDLTNTRNVHVDLRRLEPNGACNERIHIDDSIEFDDDDDDDPEAPVEFEPDDEFIAMVAADAR